MNSQALKLIYNKGCLIHSQLIIPKSRHLTPFERLLAKSTIRYKCNFLYSSY